MRFRLLMIALLALVSNACASAGKPQYYTVPPVSVVAPVVSEVTTPRPPAPEETVIVIDEVEVAWPLGMEPEVAPRPPVATPTSNNLKGKLNKGLAPYVKLDWSAGSKQSATAPVAVAKVTSTTPRPSMRNTQELQQQINNLLAQIDSLQNAELKAVQAERDMALDGIILLKQSEAITQVKLQSLRIAKHRGDLQWNAINGNGHAVASDYAVWWVVFTFVFLGVVFFLGWRIGKHKAEGVASERITALKAVNEGKNLHIRELRADRVKKDRHIAELERTIKEERRTYRNRIQELKRQRAGPLPESSNRDEPPDSVFGPYDPNDP
ncbi:MAG: hypothetical protein QG633_581 [Patescibacteria group bacterium]|nr:hypothetical protein [Patescibacteria group bacterium]